MCERKVVRKFGGTRIEKSMHSRCPTYRANKFMYINMHIIMIEYVNGANVIIHLSSYTLPLVIIIIIF